MTEIGRCSGRFCAYEQYKGERNTMESRMYGYVRVSSNDQNEDRQMIALGKTRFFLLKYFFSSVKIYHSRRNSSYNFLNF